MVVKDEKCVMIIDEKLPLGLIANTAAIMGITLGEKFPEVVGKDVDSEDLNYLGVCICGPKKKVNKLTGSLPLLR